MSLNQHENCTLVENENCEHILVKLTPQNKLTSKFLNPTITSPKNYLTQKLLHLKIPQVNLKSLHLLTGRRIS